jgi:SAM-dependent methyltransferase
MTDSTPDRPTVAGMYDFYLGGTGHSPADRAAAEKIVQLLPEVVDAAWANRGFLQRAVRRMAADWGVRQFLDIGSGLPTQHNTHDVLAEVAPDARVVYVDIDPAAVAHGRELLAGNDRVGVIQGDVRRPDEILAHPDTRRLIDRSRPVGVLLVAVLHFVPDDDDPWGLVARYLEAVPAGSYLALSHISATSEVTESAGRAAATVYAMTDNPPIDRTRTEIERFFAGLELVAPYRGGEPGLAHTGVWGAEDPAAADSEGSRLGFAAVARKP